MKKCIACNESKPLSDFGVAKSNKDGHRNTCKTCRCKESRERYTHKKALMCAQARLYKKKNADRINAINAKRRAAQLQRTPSWLTPIDFAKIRLMYTIAKHITRITGVPHQVDHIVPLQGKTVSGLHCPSNLQILTSYENNRKNNR